MKLLATNITSPLGMTTEQTYLAVRRGETGIRYCPTGTKGLPFDFQLAQLSPEQWEKVMLPDHTRFTSLAIASVKEALTHTDIPISSNRTILILSTTKGDVELLGQGHDNMPTPGDSALTIARAVGITTTPVVVCNACISGVAAQVLALRLLNANHYDHAIVCGCDVQSRFIISGFQSLKALSPEPCRPFDIERLGLNLGEAAATMIFSREADTTAGKASAAQQSTTSQASATRQSTATQEAWHVVSGAIRNDAYHISGPHPKGLGALLALQAAIGTTPPDDIAVIGVHGTATMYNDQMESKAIEQAGLSATPLSALKGYFGHTMGAAGVLETIITARALDDGIILPSNGFAERGVSGKVTISAEEMHTDKRCFVKMLSGFGGCNGAVMLTKNATPCHAAGEPSGNADCRPTDNKPQSPSLNPLQAEYSVNLSSANGDDLVSIYKERVGGYPKFYKMDILARQAFLGVELLKQQIPAMPQQKEKQEQQNDKATRPNADTAVILFNRTSSIEADRQYEASISDPENFFPSPAAFVYTLPNISTGEVAIRHALHGETSFYILSERNEQLMQQIVNATINGDKAIRQVITGWIGDNSEFTTINS